MKIFKNRSVVFLTKHGKEKVVKPILDKETGCIVVVETRFDTDKLGTFSREIKRRKSKLETARTKIKKGMKLLKVDIGIASEGSFGSHPMLSIPWNVELVLLYDKKEKMEMFGMYESSETNLSQVTTKSYDEVLKFAEKAGFPEHYLILRPENENSKSIIKDINSFDKLKDAFILCKSRSISGNVFIETDMRAYANPTRMKNIEKATQNLVSKLLNFCPKCGAPGYIIKDVVQGLPCEMCRLPSEITLKYIYGCHKCKHENEQLYPKGQFAPAQYCNFCNP
jgi:hypothetical protein